MKAACVKQICKPAAKFCDGKQPKQCNGYGTAASVLPACAAGTFCHTGVCKKKVCTPNTLKCKDTGTLRKCNALGVGWEVIGCGASQVCNANKCKKKVCDPQKSWCVGAVAKTCDKTGLKVAAQEDCGKAGKSCVQGKCIAKFCGDGDCNKGVETCATCPKDCGICPPSGCQALPTAGCGGCSCESCVCAIDPFCCSQLWSGLCAQICQNQCGSICKP